MTGIWLEKIMDIGMNLFIEKRLTGGISYIAKRYSEANNRYMKDYHPTKQSKYALYLDMNSLYSWAISRYLPEGNGSCMTSITTFLKNTLILNCYLLTQTVLLKK